MWFDIECIICSALQYFVIFRVIFRTVFIDIYYLLFIFYLHFFQTCFLLTTVFNHVASWQYFAFRLEVPIVLVSPGPSWNQPNTSHVQDSYEMKLSWNLA